MAAALSLRIAQRSAGLIVRRGVQVKPLSVNTANARMLSSAAPPALDVSGIYPPIATPFDKDENIAYEKLEQNLKLWEKFPFRGKSTNSKNIHSVFIFVYHRGNIQVLVYIYHQLQSDSSN